jgi:hypothetical protein
VLRRVPARGGRGLREHSGLFCFGGHPAERKQNKVYIQFKLSGMRFTIFATFIILVSCNTKEEPGTNAQADTLKTTGETTVAEQKITSKDTLAPVKTYANKRFKDVMVERIGKDSFLVYGQGQIFEANFNWVLEDGHDEIKKGFQTTDAGAPDWGKFKFIIHAPKKRINSMITLILFEISAMDGSRQHELPIVLY